MYSYLIVPILLEVLRGQSTHFQAQQKIAYEIYIDRLYTHATGDALSDWLASAMELNREVQASGFPIDPLW